MTLEEYLAQIEQYNEQIEENEKIILKYTTEGKDEYEKIATSSTIESETTFTSANKNDSFYLGYSNASNTMQEIDKNELKNYFISNGGKVKKIKNEEIYQIVINGNTYEYFSNSKALHVNGEPYTKCRFYATPNTKLGKVNNTITVLPGMGGTNSGAINKGNGGLDANANLNDGCLLIETYYDGHNNMYKMPNKVILPTYLGNFLANGSTNYKNHVRNSIVGYSMGSTAAFTLAAEAPKGYFDSIVAVDLGSYIQLKGGNYYDTISNSAYDKIKDMEVIFMSTVGNDPWQDQSTAQTYTNLKNHGAQNISLYSNCHKDELYKTLNSDYLKKAKNRFFNPNNKEYYVPDAIKANWNYTKHNQGYNLIENTNILSYLSR